MTFGERLKMLRLKRGWTQSQLGEKINVTKASISGYENDTRSPDKESLVRLAQILHVSTDYLLGKDSVPNREFGAKGSLVATHIDDDASDEDIEDILNYIEMRRKNPLGKK